MTELEDKFNINELAIQYGKYYEIPGINYTGQSDGRISFKLR